MVYSTDRSKAVVPVLVLLCCFVVYSMRLFVVCLTLCYFVLVFFSPFSIAITSLGEDRANLSAFRTFIWFALVWFCRFPLPFGVWEGLRFVTVALPGLFSCLFYVTNIAGYLFLEPRAGVWVWLTSAPPLYLSKGHIIHCLWKEVEPNQW